MLELVERAECRVALYVIRMAMYISIPRTLVLIHSGPSCESTHSQRPCPIFPYSSSAIGILLPLFRLPYPPFLFHPIVASLNLPTHLNSMVHLSNSKRSLNSRDPRRTHPRELEIFHQAHSWQQDSSGDAWHLRSLYPSTSCFREGPEAWGRPVGSLHWLVTAGYIQLPRHYLRNRPDRSFAATATVAMEEIDKVLDSVLGQLSDENYAQSLDSYRFWFDIGQTYYQIPSDKIFNGIWKNRRRGSRIDRSRGELIHSGAHLILRFASDAESDPVLAPYSSGLQSRLCTRTFQEFFSDNLTVVRQGGSPEYEVINLIAHWANLGYVEETAIRNHILQSLISHPTLHDHQAYTLIVLFKLAGGTFETYGDPSVVDRCFDLLKEHCAGRDSTITRLVQVRAPYPVRGGY